MWEPGSLKSFLWHAPQLFVVVQLLSRVWLFSCPWTAASQASLSFTISWNLLRLPSPVLLPGKSHGWRSLVGCSLWGHKESDTTEQLTFHFSLSFIGEENGNPLQCSCLENPRDGGAWWAAVYGVAQSWTRLKQLSSSSSMSIEFLMPSNCIILCCPLLLLPSIFPRIRVFSNELALRNRWPKYWSFSFRPPNEYSGLTSFRINWFANSYYLHPKKYFLFIQTFTFFQSCECVQLSSGGISLLWFLRKLSTCSSCIVHLDILFCEVQV